jgi:hypothetical protein
MKKLVCLIILILSFSCCSKYIHYTRTDPPEIILDKQQKRIALINQFDYTSQDYNKNKPIIAFLTGVNAFGKTLSDYSNNDSTLRFIYADTLFKTKSSLHDSDNIMPADTIKYLCKLYNSDLLLTLDSLNFDFTYEIEVSVTDDVKKSRNAVYYLHSYYYLSLYDTIGLLKRTYLGKTLVYANRPVIAWVIPLFEPKNLAKALDEIVQLANESGSEYIGMFLPSVTKTGGDKLYTGKVFAESNSLIFQNKYDEAIELLTAISSSPNSKWAEKAKHNLLVAEELKKRHTY